MAGKKENIKALFSNTRTRVIILFTIILLCLTVVIGFFKLNSLRSSDLDSVSSVRGSPGIRSIPGALDPTAQYATLQEQQNISQAEAAVKRGGSAIPTLIRTQHFGEGADLIGAETGGGGLGFAVLSSGPLDSPQKSLWIQKLQDEKCSHAAIKSVVDEGALIGALHQACSCSQLRQYGYTLDDLMHACSCPELKAIAFSATELKTVGYTADKLKRCGFSACETRGAEFSAEEMKEGGYSDGELKGAGFSDAVISEASGLPAGVSLSDIRQAGSSPEALAQLREKGVSAAAIRRITAASAADLKAAGFSATDLKRAKMSAAELLAAGFTPTELRRGGYSAQDLLKAGISAKDLLAAGFSPEAIKAAQKGLPQLPKSLLALRSKGDINNIEGLRAARAAGVSAELIRDALGSSAGALKAAGYSAQELKDAGYNAAELSQAGFTPSALKAAGYSASDLRAAGIDAAELKRLGFRAADLKAAGFDAGVLKALGYTAAQLKAAGYTAEQLKAAGYTAAQLKAAGYTAAQLKAAGYAAGDLKAAGFNADELRQAGFSPRVLKAAEFKASGYTAMRLKSMGYTAEELKAAGYTPADLRAAGYTVADLKAAGFSAAELRQAGFTPRVLKAAELKATGYTPARLKAAGYTAEELKAVGYTEADLTAAGYTAEELKAAGYTNAELSAEAGALAGGLDVLSPNPSNITGSSRAASSLTPLAALQPVKRSNNDGARSETKELQKLMARQQGRKLDQRYKEQVRQESGRMLAAANQALQGWKTVSTQVFIAGNLKDEDITSNDAALSSGLTRINPNEGVESMDMNQASRPHPGIFIKTGDILFAVLDTSVNTDEPGPILATIVSGSLKGSKLIGSFTLPSNANKMVLTFNTLSMLGSDRTVSISSYAIDPSTARTALSGRVNHHYLMRYGSLFASTFLAGFSSAIQSADTTITIGGTGGTTDTTVQNGINRSLLENTLIGLGEVGKAWSETAQQLMNRPTTVELYSGTGMGILFTQDVQLG